MQCTATSTTAAAATNTTAAATSTIAADTSADNVIIAASATLVDAISPSPSIKYVNRLQHGLLHETFQGIGNDYEKRDSIFGQIDLPVVKAELTTNWWMFRCQVPHEVNMTQEEEERAEFFIQEMTIGIVQEETNKPALIWRSYNNAKG